MKVQNKVIVVTGGGAGMGRELVLSLLARGARVAALDMNEAALQETASLAGNYQNSLSLHVVNITDKQVVDALPEQIIQRHGSVDGIINNAGIIQPFVRLKDLDFAAVERVMNVNFYGLLYMTKAFLPHLLQRPEAHIVNTSSMGGFLPVPGQTIYGASKAAVKLMTEGLNSELLETNVRVSIVFPGAIGTNIAENSGVSIGNISTKEMEKAKHKTLTPKDAAKIIVDGMEANRYRILVGSDAKFMDFIYRLAPEFAAKFIFKQMKSLLPS